MSKWISVKDSLPQKEGIYWVCFEVGGKRKTHYCLWEEKSRKYLGNKFGWRSREYVRSHQILYWMPLPKPPEDK